jgi:hypothetical protein
MAQDVADRRGDVPLGEHPGRDLVEQRLEEVVVGAIDHHHLDRRAPQGLGGEQPGEPAADDDDVAAAFATSAARSARMFAMYWS